MKHVNVELTAQEVAVLTDPIRQRCAILLSVVSDDGSTQVTLLIPQTEEANSKPKANGKRPRRPKTDAAAPAVSEPAPPPPKIARAGAHLGEAGGEKKT